MGLLLEGPCEIINAHAESNGEFFSTCNGQSVCWALITFDNTQR